MWHVFISSQPRMISGRQMARWFWRRIRCFILDRWAIPRRYRYLSLRVDWWRLWSCRIMQAIPLGEEYQGKLRTFVMDLMVPHHRLVSNSPHLRLTHAYMYYHYSNSGGQMHALSSAKDTAIQWWIVSPYNCLSVDLGSIAFADFARETLATITPICTHDVYTFVCCLPAVGVFPGE